MPTRRRFLTAASALVASNQLFRIHADDKTGNRPAIVGKGEFRYECNHDWCRLPARTSWQTTHGVAIDAAGLVYITHQGYGPNSVDTVLVFDPKGQFVRSFGKELFGGGHGIDIRAEGGEEFLYLSDFAHGIVLKCTLLGEVANRLSTPREPMLYSRDRTFRPTNVAFGSTGDFYVADGYGENCIHRYDRAGVWKNTFGSTGSDLGQFKTPHSLWWDDRPGREPLLIVADRANARLQYFSAEGKPVASVAGVLFPADFDIRGNVLLVADLHGRLSLFGPDLRVLAHLGDDPEWTEEVKKLRIRNDPAAWPAGKFVHPHDACFDHAGNIFVAEWVRTGRVSRLRLVG